MKVKSLSHVWLFATPWTTAYQAPLSVGFSRQEYWNGLPLLSPNDLPNPGIKPRSHALWAEALPSEPLEKSNMEVRAYSNKELGSVGFPSGSVGQESACNVRGLGSIPGSGRLPGGGHGSPLQ